MLIPISNSIHITTGIIKTYTGVKFRKAEVKYKMCGTNAKLNINNGNLTFKNENEIFFKLCLDKNINNNTNINILECTHTLLKTAKLKLKKLAKLAPASP